MNDPLLGVMTPETSAVSGPKLERTHARAMASMAVSLVWASEQARHTDCLVVRKLNLV